MLLPDKYGLFMGKDMNAESGHWIMGILVIHFLCSTKLAISKRLTSDKRKAHLLIAQGAEAISARGTSDILDERKAVSRIEKQCFAIRETMFYYQRYNVLLSEITG